MNRGRIRELWAVAASHLPGGPLTECIDEIQRLQEIVAEIVNLSWVGPAIDSRGKPLEEFVLVRVERLYNLQEKAQEALQ